LVIGQGELVFEAGLTGVLAKVGNGFSRYSELEFWPDPAPILFTLRGEFAAADELLRVDLEGQLEQGYTTLNTRITTEVTVLAGADMILGQRIDTIQADLNSTELRLNSRIATESEARIAGDTALANRTTILEARAETTEATVADNVARINIAEARITEESEARVTADLAQATRTDTLEVALRTVTRSSSSNLIGNSVLDTGIGWRFEGNTYAGPLLEIFGPGTPAMNGIIFDITASGQSSANPFDPLDNDDFLPLTGRDVDLTFRYASQIFKAEPYDIDYIIVGGGGAAMTLAVNTGGGGGGAGGLIQGVWRVAPGNVYEVVVGPGGFAGADALVAQGQPSSAFGLTALGGGHGGGATAPIPAGSGGSGGGGTGGNAGQPAPGANGLPPQGNRGGTGVTSGATEQRQNGAGGGGYVSQGQDAGDTTAGLGGDGLMKTIGGVQYELAAGGNGWRRLVAGVQTNGQPNTGQGGEGGRNNNNTNNKLPGNGGSGVVILEMDEENYTGNVTGAPQVFIANGRVTLRFIGNGSYTA
jgi:hypothetical protein